ncbi:MAG: hypothetical protein KAT79_03855 [candidate division Zixibacteria bacterium]|nr:hypothetical protein [candidate division Zixibacteria bacterium]
MIRSAWVSDDAYISFRTVDNFVNGYGLTWNVAERVQGFTHPLWVLLMTVTYLFSGEFYYSVLTVSILLTLLSAAVLTFRLASTSTAAVLAILALIASKAFIDYSTSGLENPLSHFLLVAFFAAYLSDRKFEWARFTNRLDKKALTLALLAALAMVNRLDTILFYMPALSFYLITHRSRRTLLSLLLGFIPLAAWLTFSIIYYGVPFPNTAYAKLKAGIERYDLIIQGFRYWKAGFLNSPFTVIVISSGCLYGLLSRSRHLAMVALGLLLYSCYIVPIGGDFMVGRFLSAPLIVAVAILSRHRFTLSLSSGTMIATTCLILALGWPFSPVRVGSDFGTGEEIKFWVKGIGDERAGYYQFTGLLVQSDSTTVPNHKWIREGLRAREWGDTVLVRAGIGFYSCLAGPKIHVVDAHALTDPLLSRLPVFTPKKWRIGHFRRVIPDGYLATLESENNLIEDPSLAEYYDKLSVLIHSDILSTKRFIEIWKFNTGAYDYLLEEYIYQPRKIAFTNFRRPRRPGTPYLSPGCMVVRSPGLLVEMDSTYHARQVEVSVDSNDRYILHFRLDSTELGTARVDPEFVRGGLQVSTVPVPAEAVQGGYNNILITPEGGDETYSIGHLRLL